MFILTNLINVAKQLIYNELNVGNINIDEMKQKKQNKRIVYASYNIYLFVWNKAKIIGTIEYFLTQSAQKPLRV